MAFDPDAYLKEGTSTSGFDPDAYLGIEKKKPSLSQIAQLMPKMAGLALQDTASRMGPPSLPIIGGAIGGPIGAGAGEFARQAVETVHAPENVPQTALGRFGSVVSAGLAQEPKMLTAIPGIGPAIGKVGEMASNLVSKAGKGAAKFGEALTGAKASALEQAAKQGVSTYAAPSMEKAQGIFGDALAKEGIAARPPLKQVIDPALTTARKVALDVGDKLEKGVDLTAQDALRGRQAIDRIYNATPLLDRQTRGNLADLRTAFDGVLSNKSGALADASRIYRQAIVKDTILNPFRITKQGQISAVAPMVATLAASAGLGAGHKEGSALGGLGYLAASSPALAGLAATMGGSGARAFGQLAGRPEVRQALLQVLERMQANRNAQ